MCAETVVEHSSRGHFPLAILAKAPVPGKAKTRLIPALGAEGAAALQAQLIRHTLATALQATNASAITLWTALEHRHPLFVELAQQTAITLKAQPSGNLGVRMYHALSAMQSRGVLIGTDCPMLDAELLRHCQHCLEHADSVFLPAEDGGYGLVGMRRPSLHPFTDIDWGTSAVMAQTLRRLKQIQWSHTCPSTVWDVDRPDDLDRLYALDEKFRCGKQHL
ncbi:TIGR04282 family arsenosugar biosynthesis glycosyltransferase [Halomonas huangheensis]|uniref:Glycosyltransferase n=1 Tax=Halomonas huangheensis TaxID=1178482 RepID=W1N8E3_9GAMM|nr:TIGR04282 family arsenosugar biosynthesis glycosyltransferase [Halomonas huangheensis]ALM53501.1 hypothetical protein AR456_15400 [Halomonas huangheensis]ERL51817.1 hypothetical protein BJB45_11675 [Halomonas huangheensis]